MAYLHWFLSYKLSKIEKSDFGPHRPFTTNSGTTIFWIAKPGTYVITLGLPHLTFKFQNNN